MLDDLGALFDELADLSLEPGPGGLTVRIDGSFDPRVRLQPDEINIRTADDTAMMASIDLETRSQRGWFTWLDADEARDLPRGVQLYVRERLLLFVQLEAQGWTDSELAEYAEFEDAIVSADVDPETGDMSYIDDDLALLAREQRDALGRFEQEQQRRFPEEERRDGTGSFCWSSDVAALSGVELEHKRQEADRHLRRLQCATFESFSAKAQVALRRAAAWSRVRDEFGRVMLLAPERQQLQAGFSFSIAFRGPRALIPDPATPSSFGEIDWHQTLASPSLLENLDRARLRLPGLVLQGERITTSKIVPPNEYARLYEQFRLGDYLAALAAQRGDRFCVHCQKALAAGSADSKKYCSVRCAAAARQRVYRRRAKEKVLRRVRRDPSAQVIAAAARAPSKSE